MNTPNEYTDDTPEFIDTPGGIEPDTTPVPPEDGDRDEEDADTDDEALPVRVYVFRQEDGSYFISGEGNWQDML